MTPLERQRLLRCRRVRHACTGALLGIGAPIGWLLLQWWRGVPIATELSQHPMLIGYLLIGTTLAFSTFGWLIGAQADCLIELTRRLDRLTVTDELTGLRNRRYFLQRLDEAIALAERTESALSVAIVDLDLFKTINDRFGHLVGDRALTGVAGELESNVRRGETLARVGGEEFAVLLPGTDASEALQAADRLRLAVRELRLELNHVDSIRLTASVGVASAVGKTTAEVLLDAADRALYRAKANGRDRVSVATPSEDPPTSATAKVIRANFGQARAR